MIKQHYSGSARRSMNIIWNAAGSYDFDPPFLAFFQNGQPDDYLNMIIGLSVKWLDFPRITGFFERLGTGSTRDEASSVLWLGIENCMAFGDGANDLTRVRMAGLGVAMSNACPEVLAAADHVTLSNDEDGVAVAIRKMVLFK